MITDHFEAHVRRWSIHRRRVSRPPTRAEDRLLEAGFMPATGYMAEDPYADA